MRRLDTPQYQFALRDEASLRALFERAIREPRGEAQDSSITALHEAVCAFVRGAKGGGVQVETIIIALKDIFGVPDRPLRAFEEPPPSVRLSQRVVRWCIEEYFGPGSDVPAGE